MNMPVAIKPVYPETSIRRLCGMSMFGKGVAINSRFLPYHVSFALILALVTTCLAGSL